MLIMNSICRLNSGHEGNLFNWLLRRNLCNGKQVERSSINSKRRLKFLDECEIQIIIDLQGACCLGCIRDRKVLESKYRGKNEWPKGNECVLPI